MSRITVITVTIDHYIAIAEQAEQCRAEAWPVYRQSPGRAAAAGTVDVESTGRDDWAVN